MSLKNKLNNNQFNNKPATTNNNQVQKPQQKNKTIQQLIIDMKSQIEMALPKHLTSDRFQRITMTAIRNNPKLANCNAMSLIAGMMQSAQLGLEPNTPLGEAYLIPYNTKHGPEAQFQIGYKGLISLAYRTGEYESISAHEVYPEDEFDYEYGLFPSLKHKPSADDHNSEPIFYYAVYVLKNGGRDFRVWSTSKIKKHAENYSKAVQKGWTSPWKTDFDAMAKKTVLIDVLKYAPKSVEFSKVVSTNETIKTDLSENMVDITPIYENEQPDDENKTTQEKPQTKEDEPNNYNEDEINELWDSEG